MMNENLQLAVASLIEKALSFTDTSISLLSEEIPEVVQQLLLWEGVASFLWFLISIAMVSVLFHPFLRSFVGKGERKENGRYKETATHDFCGEVGPHSIVTALVLLSYLATTLTIFDMKWLQILLAPKVFLLEYASQLVK